MGLPLPRRISLIGVEVVPPQGFSAELSPELAARLEEIARQVRRTLLHLLGS
jgi:hypothetical protein